MWQNEKKREMERRKALQNLQQDLFNMHRRAENIEKVCLIYCVEKHNAVIITVTITNAVLLFS